MTAENKPITFKEWQKKKGQLSWWESPVVIDELHVCSRMIEVATKEMALALVKKLFESGSKLAPPEIDTIRMPLLHAWAINGDVKTEYECLPEQYLYHAFLEWKYGIMEWEEKSLWGYLRHWVKRTISKRR